MITILQEDRKEAVQAFLREQLDAEGALTPPRYVNGPAILSLDRTFPEVFEYQGILFRAPPMPYTEGVKLQDIRRRFEALRDRPDTPESLTETLQLLHECAAIFRRNARPVAWLHRIFWGLAPNPFLTMSEAEVVGLLSFFSMCRMRSSVRLPSLTAKSDGTK